MLFAIHENIDLLERATSRFHPEKDDENKRDNVESGVDEIGLVTDCFERVREGEGDHEANAHCCKTIAAWLDLLGM